MEKNFGLGMLGVTGVEWFATDVISFHAEYRLIIKYYWHSDYEEYRNGNYVEISEDDYESVYVDGGSYVYFGISIYF